MNDSKQSSKVLRSELLKTSIHLDTFKGRLDEVIRRLCKIREECVKTHTDIEIELTLDWYDKDLWIALRGSRPETEKETRNRLRKEANDAEREKKRREYMASPKYKEYERLKKELGL